MAYVFSVWSHISNLLIHRSYIIQATKMTTDIGIQDLLDKIDNLTDLIAKVKIAEQYKDIQRIKNDTLVEYQNKIQEAEREIEELEVALESAAIKADTVDKIHNEKIESLTKHKGEIAINDIEYDRAFSSNKDLEAQLKAKEKELEEESHSEHLAQYPSQESLPLIIYEGIGVRLPLDSDGHVRKALLNSQRHDLLTLALEDDYTFQTATRIWEFISK